MSTFGLIEDFNLQGHSLDELLIKNRGATYLFRMKGMEMAPLIFDNDILIVDRSLPLTNLATALFEIDGRFLVREVIFRAGQKFLKGRGDKLTPLSSEAILFGVVRSIIRESYGKSYRSS